MSKKPDVFMPIFLGDFQKHTMRLNRSEVGAYMLLLMDYWVNGPPPDDHETLALICRCPPTEWPATWAKVSVFFSLKSGRWTQKRSDQELVKARARSAKARKAAKAKQAAIKARKEGCAPSTRRALSKQVLRVCHSQSPSQDSISAPTEQRDTIPAVVAVARLDGAPTPPAQDANERKQMGERLRELAAEVGAARKAGMK